MGERPPEREAGWETVIFWCATPQKKNQPNLTWMRKSACRRRLNNMSAMILLTLGKG